jgi:mevalonate kinase
MWFGSNIPEGAGLGSSGALVAAIYDRYKTEENNNLKELKGQLALLERHFHGKSSGTAPLVSYLCTPLRIESNGSVHPAPHRPQNKFGPTMFLVDTAIRSKTNHLVEWFLSRWNNDRAFRKIIDNRYEPLVDRLIGEFSDSYDHRVWDDLRLLSEIQQSIFQPMIPDSFKDHFAKGLKSDHFLLKLCGSGGGGFMLGFTKEKGLVDEYFSHYHLPVFYIEH